MSLINPLQNKWPADSEADGKVYSLECGYNMRAKMVSVNGQDEVAIDLDGAIIWETVATVSAVPEFEEFSGTYAEVAAKAEFINAEQKRLNGDVEHVFYPSPIELLAA